jgi:hypothetical protein
MIRPLLILLSILFSVSSCSEFHKGDKFSSAIAGDSLQYVIIAKGNGRKLSEKAHLTKQQHEAKGNVCEINYLTDSVSLQDKSALLLFNSMLPDIQQDMLTKGFFGTFTSKQSVTLHLVSVEDFNRFFNP